MIVGGARFDDFMVLYVFSRCFLNHLGWFGLEIKENFLICFKKVYIKFLYYLHLIIISFFIEKLSVLCILYLFAFH